MGLGQNFRATPGRVKTPGRVAAGFWVCEAWSGVSLGPDKVLRRVFKRWTGRVTNSGREEIIGKTQNSSSSYSGLPLGAGIVLENFLKLANLPVMGKLAGIMGDFGVWGFSAGRESSRVYLQALNLAGVGSLAGILLCQKYFEHHSEVLNANLSRRKVTT